MRKRHNGVPGAWTTRLGTVVAAVTLAGASVALTGQAGAAGNPVGSACGYWSNVSLFDGPYGSEGCPPQTSTYASAGSLAPAVTLPPGGTGTLVKASDPDGAEASYGPATLFGGRPTSTDSYPPSGALKVTTTGITAVTSTASVQNVGPDVFQADAVSSTCTADSTAKKGKARITNGTVTSTDANGDPSSVTSIPDPPPKNYTVTGQLQHIGDSFKVVFNEHIKNANGSLTENAVHMYLLGPTAKGDLIIAQTVCGI